MTLYLTVEDVRKLVGMDDALAALDRAFQHWHDAGTPEPGATPASTRRAAGRST